MEDKECKDCKKSGIITVGNFKFRGCHCEPYKGKWIIEIKECPKKEEQQCSQDLSQ